MVRSSKLAPNQVMFKVPIHLNKFDIRDYLTNIYKVNVTDVRTFILPGKRQRDMRTAELVLSKRQKKTIVTLDKDFVYPDPPSQESFGHWSTKLRDILRKGRSKGWKIRLSPQQKAVAAKAFKYSEKEE
ncbi:hypothetical protein BB560_005630 [Smittium megazygosporum]|uniref:Large ribosomal subunit protein uL23m n=1 Tax=Smittium megazygosporum TaxID=133381 RepID=A0A2T9Z243_9FUNG|nr:hypothetical protein BB560_005630 [Smittium megazygosporum]